MITREGKQKYQWDAVVDYQFGLCIYRLHPIKLIN